MSNSSQSIGKYYESSFAFHLSNHYNIPSSINLQNLAQSLGISTQTYLKKDKEANKSSLEVKTKLDSYYKNETPSSIKLVPVNPKIIKYFSSIDNSFDDSNPSDVLIEFSSKTIPEEKYFGISLKSTSRGKTTVKANIGIETILKLFGNPHKLQGKDASEFLYDLNAKTIIDRRRMDVGNNYKKYGLSKKPINYFGQKWFKSSFVNSLGQNYKNIFKLDAKQIKDNYINYFLGKLQSTNQNILKKFIIEDCLKEVSLPIYIISKSSGGSFTSFSADKILRIASSNIIVSTRKTPKDTYILLKSNSETFVTMRIKYSSSQDMTNSIKIEIT